MKEKINELYSKDNNNTYKVLLELETICTESNELYEYFDEFINMLKSDKSFVRVRGFRLICSLAKWDKDNKINKNINSILEEFNDDKGTSIRQCLAKLNILLLYKTELNDIIKNKLLEINTSIYKDGIRPLIEKDIKNITNNL